MLAVMRQENILARYKILHELGRGATGAVYAARDRETGAVVALKRLDPALSSKYGADFAERFLKHARSAGALKHQNTVKVHAAGEAAGTAYVAMEMLEGESLRKILDDGPLPVAHAIRIAHDIACGLAYAHLEGAVHGGLRPSNIIVLRSGAAKITDFGTGQLGPAVQRYMSPEQLRGEGVDHRSDVFSLGALFYEMLAHQPPSEGDAAPPAAMSGQRTLSRPRFLLYRKLFQRSLKLHAPSSCYSDASDLLSNCSLDAVVPLSFWTLPSGMPAKNPPTLKRPQ